MKIFILTPAGEQGPYTPAQINRLHGQGKVQPDQLCRVEGTGTNKPIKEVFRHLAPDQAVVTTARKQVATYNRDAGSAGATTGVILLIIGILCLFFFNPYNVGVGLIIVGATVFAQGCRQIDRGQIPTGLSDGEGGTTGRRPQVSGTPEEDAGAQAQVPSAGESRKEPKSYDY